MTYQIYSQQQLEGKNRSELWAICKQRGIKCFPKAEDCRNAILESQPQRIEKSELPKVGDRKLIGKYVLTCTSVGGDTAVNWQVNDYGEIMMVWAGAWRHNLSHQLFAETKDVVEDLERLYKEREARSKQVEVVERVDDEYVVRSSNNYYVVRPSHPDKHQRCECGDAHFRGAICKHQIAAKQQEEIFQSGEIYEGIFNPIPLYTTDSTIFYYRFPEDAINRVNPVAMRAKDVKVGDMVDVGEATKVTRISYGLKQGVKCWKIFCDNGECLDRWFYELVRLAA